MSLDPVLKTIMCRQCADRQPGDACQFRSLPQNNTVFLQKSHYSVVVFEALNYLHCWMAHLDDWRARWLSIAYIVCLPQNKSSSLAYIVSIKGNLRWILGKLSGRFSVGGFAAVLIVSNYVLIRWSLETHSDVQIVY